MRGQCKERLIRVNVFIIVSRGHKCYNSHSWLNRMILVHVSVLLADGSWQCIKGQMGNGTVLRGRWVMAVYLRGRWVMAVF